MNFASAASLPRCILITPARNEEKILERTIQSVVAQTVVPMKWVIVNDGSSDSTPAIIDRYAATFHWIERLDMPAHRDRSFAAKANCVNAARRHVSALDHDVIGNIDADVTFEPDY